MERIIKSVRSIRFVPSKGDERSGINSVTKFPFTMEMIICTIDANSETVRSACVKFTCEYSFVGRRGGHGDRDRVTLATRYLDVLFLQSHST